MANNSVRYPPELRERAVRMVLEATREGVYSWPFANSWDCGLAGWWCELLCQFGGCFWWLEVGPDAV